MNKPQRVTKTLVAHLKREAKRRSRMDRQPHSHHLDLLAVEHGHRDWAHLIREFDRPAEKSPAQIRAALALADAREDAALDFSVPIDPALPSNFDDTPNERRSEAELKTWWNRPFAVTYPDGSLVVRCLDGGAWDRTTYYGVADSHEHARTIAREMLLRWLAWNREERSLIDEDGIEWRCRMSVRPNREPVMIERAPPRQRSTQPSGNSDAPPDPSTTPGP